MEVRKDGRVALAVAVAALLVAVLLFVWRDGVAGYLVGALMLVIAGAQGWAAYDSRLPMLLFDEQGVRLRFGQTWRGFPWSAVESVEHTPRPGGWTRFWKDGRIGVLLRDEEAAVHDLSSSARRQALLTERLYGLPFAVPLGLSTRVLGAGEDLTLSIAALAGDDVEVAEIDPTMAEEAGVLEDVPPHVPAQETGRETESVPGDIPHDDRNRSEEPAARTAPTTAASAAEIALVGGGDTNPRMPRVDAADSAAGDEGEPEPESVEEPEEAAATTAVREKAPSALRETSTAVRADVRYTPERRAQHKPEPEPDSDLPPRPVLPEMTATARRSKRGKQVDGFDLDSVGPKPAAEPVIGPEISAARIRLALSVEALAEWTRIRPHVIEAIEVDDFGPCGGDFYARGHLRTLARVLAIEVAPLLEAYDEKYASGPVSPRTVFSAELSRNDPKHPLTGGRRGGGPTWSVLVAAVMAVVLVWSVARLIIDGTEQPKSNSAIQLDGSAGTTNPYANSKPTTAAPAKVVVTAAGGGAHVVVRDARGKVAFTGDLAFGQSKTLQVAAPLRVQTSDGSLTVGINGDKGQPLGKTGEAAQRTYTGG